MSQTESAGPPPGPLPITTRRMRSAWAKAQPRLAYGYMRVSTDEQNCDPQRDAIQAFYDGVLAPRGYRWGGWYEEVGVSGKTLLRNRPEGFRLSQAVEPGDIVVFAKLDRGFRNRSDCLATIDAWQERGVNVALLDVAGGIDTSTPQGEAMLGMMATFAQMERRLIGARTKEALAARRRQGKPTGRIPPYGYRIVRRGPGQAWYVPDTQTRADVRLLMQWKALGHSEERIVIHLLRHRIMRTSTGRPWTQQGLNLACHAEVALTQAEADANYPTPDLPEPTFAHLDPPQRRDAWKR